MKVVYDKRIPRVAGHLRRVKNRVVLRRGHEILCQTRVSCVTKSIRCQVPIWRRVIGGGGVVQVVVIGKSKVADTVSRFVSGVRIVRIERNILIVESDLEIANVEAVTKRSLKVVIIIIDIIGVMTFTWTNKRIVIKCIVVKCIVI